LRQLVLQNQPTDLANLIRLGFSGAWLDIDDLLQSIANKYVVVTAYSLDEAQALQRASKVVETNISIRSTVEYPPKNFRVRCHAQSLRKRD
jgi:hypothetical protein